jgi:phosphoribosylpyrophosphate synthetase
MNREYTYDGFDIDEYNKRVTYINEHENVVNTLLKDLPISYPYTVEGHNFNITSLFARESWVSDIFHNKDIDGNPVIHAYKRKYNWKFVNEANRNAFTKRLKEVAKKLTPCDTLILIPSSSGLNEEIGILLEDSIHYKKLLTSVFRKPSTEETHLATNIDSIKEPYKGILIEDFKSMGRMFELNKVSNRDIVLPYMKLIIAFNEDITLSGLRSDLQDKRVVIFDDTITTGVTVSRAARLLLEMCSVEGFEPASVDVLTVFSAKNIMDAYEEEWDCHDSDYYLEDY